LNCKDFIQETKKIAAPRKTVDHEGTQRNVLPAKFSKNLRIPQA
jgi:hypothetical protein